jgi:hypothetical protein
MSTDPLSQLIKVLVDTRATGCITQQLNFNELLCPGVILFPYLNRTQIQFVGTLFCIETLFFCC